MLAVAGQPRHPRPAGVDLQVPPDYATEYGVRDQDGGLAPLRLEPLLDAIAARYDGCRDCERHQVAVVATSPALTAHTVGVALSASDEPGASTVAAARVVLDRYEDGGPIALALRAYGPVAAVELAASMTATTRRAALTVALGLLLPAGRYDTFLGTFYPNTDRLPRSAADAALLAELHTEGRLAWRPPAAPPA